jgi:hypothetical protein
MECLHQFTGQQQVTLLTGWQFMSGTTNNEAKNTSAVINSSARRSRNDIASAYVPTRHAFMTLPFPVAGERTHQFIDSSNLSLCLPASEPAC